jgi:hypothetical protein
MVWTKAHMLSFAQILKMGFKIGASRLHYPISAKYSFGIPRAANPSGVLSGWKSGP